MTHAYSEMYLEDAMRTLGEAVDFALCDQGLTPAEGGVGYGLYAMDEQLGL